MHIHATGYTLSQRAHARSYPADHIGYGKPGIWSGLRFGGYLTVDSYTWPCPHSATLATEKRSEKSCKRCVVNTQRVANTTWTLLGVQREKGTEERAASTIWVAERWEKLAKFATA